MKYSPITLSGKPGVAAVFLVAGGLLISSIAVTYWAGLRAVESNRKLSAIRSVIDHLDQFLSTMKDAETGQRGYLLTGKDAYLTPYHAAVDATGVELAALDNLAARGDLPAGVVAQVRDLASEKLAELAQTIKARRTNDLGGALVMVLSDRGLQLMEHLRSSIGDLRSEEEAEFKRAAQAAENAIVMRAIVLVLAALLNVAFLAWAYRRIAEEIAKREAANSEALRQKEFCATTLASIGDGVIVTDTEARITFMNHVAEILTGWSAEEAEGIVISDVFKIVNERTRATVENPVRHVLRSGVVSGLANHTLLIRRDGRELNIDDSGAPICDSGGQIRGVVLVFRDITDRHRAEEALRESEERFRLLFQQAAVGIKRLDADGRLLEVNDRLCEILGYGREELLQFSLQDFTYADDLPRERAELARLLAGEIPCFSIEKRCLRKDGGVIWVRVTASLPSRAGRTPWWISIIEDITERKQAEEALRKTTEELARSNHDLEQFAYVASHDLQEPLRMVAGYLQLLSDRYHGQLDEKADKFIAYAVDGAERMSGLTRDLLAYSRVNSGAQQFQRTSAEEALNFALTNLASAIQESGAAIHCDPLPVVRADGAQLRQLFQNLLGNAVKFRSPDRAPEIRVSAQKDPRGWRFTVEDNGIGFDEKYQDKMFLIFQRLHGRGKYAGTGIGLAICKRIVERHGGTIWAKGRPGQGATFYFTIPDEGLP